MIKFLIHKTYLGYTEFQNRRHVAPDDPLTVIPGIGRATRTLKLPDTNDRGVVTRASVLIGHFLLDTTNDGSGSFQRVST